MTVGTNKCHDKPPIVCLSQEKKTKMETDVLQYLVSLLSYNLNTAPADNADERI
jgi:hypothetical protein